MGQGNSSTQSINIQNQNARSFFESFVIVQRYIPEKAKKKNKALMKIIYESLKRIPEDSETFSILVSGKSIGSVFFDYYFPNLIFPETLTKISLRKCSLKAKDARLVAKLICKLPKLQQLDLSENSFGDKAKLILQAATTNESLHSLNMENTKINFSSLNAITELALTSRKIETLLLSPIKLKKGETCEGMKTAIRTNIYLKNVEIDPDIDEELKDVYEKNNIIYEIVDSIARYPFQKNYINKVDSFKSVKGREMLMGRAGQKEKIRGTKFFENIEQADARAKTIEKQETHQNNELFRSGHAEMIGRRANMEDVSISLVDTPKPGAIMFGLFDGHGGREAAEYASENLPGLISKSLTEIESEKEAYEYAFKALQIDMQAWCVYVGTTSVIAVIQEHKLTVANIGDSRCVLCRDGKAIRLSFDHKPDLFAEKDYIQSKGGFVRDGRIRGMLAVSRAFGDGFLGESVNPIPHFRQVDLTENDLFLILACDGVWDVITDQEACNIVSTEIDPMEAAKKLRDAAFEKNSLDNISVIIVYLAESFLNISNDYFVFYVNHTIIQNV